MKSFWAFMRQNWSGLLLLAVVSSWLVYSMTEGRENERLAAERGQPGRDVVLEETRRMVGEQFAIPHFERFGHFHNQQPSVIIDPEPFRWFVIDSYYADPGYAFGGRYHRYTAAVAFDPVAKQWSLIEAEGVGSRKSDLSDP